MRKSPAIRGIFVVSLVLIAIPLLAALWKISSDPDVVFLLQEGDAEWIQVKRTLNLGIWRSGEWIVYRKQFTVENTQPNALLTIRSLRTAQVFLDGRLVLPFNDPREWKHPRRLDLKNLLTPGQHELRVIVFNENGPTALLAHCEALKIFTDEDWKASIDGIQWMRVASLNDRGPLELSQEFVSTFQALWKLLPWYLAMLFLYIVFFGSARKTFPALKEVPSRPSVVRWILVGAWVLLGANNITKIPLDVGFDFSGHYDYISYIAKKGRFPLATEGWQMFQSPLYYLISALQQIILAPFFSTEKIQMLLRVIPLVCGAVQVELTYRAVKIVFPERKDLQVMGTAVGGLLPMNLYLSQAVGNEPLAGVLSSASIVMTLWIMNSDAGPVSMRRVVLLGIVVGLALLTKVTAALLIPAVALALLYGMVKKEEPLKRIAGLMVTLLSIITLISGWYYFRNWIELGRPFVGGWEVSRGIVWWQDPGFRTLHDLISFGKSLSQPVFSGIYGFWDSMYSTFWMDGFLSGISSYEIRPPWNYTLMLSGALLSLLPALAIIAGVISVVVNVRASGSYKNFSVYCILLYIAALLYLYVTVPIYSTAKATYTIGLTPCYAIMCAAGLDLLTRNRYLRSVVSFLVISWALTVYFSYFVL